MFSTSFVCCHIVMIPGRRGRCGQGRRFQFSLVQSNFSSFSNFPGPGQRVGKGINHRGAEFFSGRIKKKKRILKLFPKFSPEALKFTSFPFKNLSFKISHGALKIVKLMMMIYIKFKIGVDKSHVKKKFLLLRSFYFITITLIIFLLLTPPTPGPGFSLYDPELRYV